MINFNDLNHQQHKTAFTVFTGTCYQFLLLKFVCDKYAGKTRKGGKIPFHSTVALLYGITTIVIFVKILLYLGKNTKTKNK